MDLSTLNGDAEFFLRSLADLSFLEGAATASLLATAFLYLLLKTVSFVFVALGACYLLMHRWRKGLILILTPLLSAELLHLLISGGSYLTLWFWLLAAVSYPAYWASRKLARKVSGWKKRVDSEDPGAASILWSAFRRSRTL